MFSSSYVNGLYLCNLLVFTSLNLNSMQIKGLKFSLGMQTAGRRVFGFSLEEANVNAACARKKAKTLFRCVKF